MKRQHEAFARAMAEGKDEIATYKELYPKATDEAARIAAIRLLKRQDIQTAIATNKKEIVTIAQSLAAEELKDETKRRALSMADYREILHDIAHGNFSTKQWNGAEKNYVLVYPTAKDAMDAVKLDMELTGVGFRPPEDGEKGGGNTYNTFLRKVVFNTRVTTSKQEIIQNGE